MPKKKSSNNYFTAETEAALIRFTKERDLEVRNRIYREELEYPFFKLTQNIIHTFKFYNTDETNLENVQHEVISFLMSKFHLFDPSRGAKAYSYFGTIAKRYLIAQNNQHYKKKLETYSLDSLKIEDESGLGNYDSFIDPSLDLDASNHLHAGDELSEFMDKFVEFYYDNLETVFPKPEDAKIADVVLNLFKNREDLPIINKKAIYIYIKEQLDVKTVDVTKVTKQLGSFYKNAYTTYLEHGIVKFETK